MTQGDWLICDDPGKMLSFLESRGRTSKRKLRLFALACYRRIENWEGSDDVHPALRVSEGVAEGVLAKKQLRAARREVGGIGSYSARASANNAIGATVEDNASTAAREASRHAADYFGYLGMEEADDGPETWRSIFVACAEAELKVQANLLRDIFSSVLFRPLPEIPLFLLAWNDGCIPKLARNVYEERDFSQESMAVLADALEEAGVVDEEVLEHCRRPAMHVRGCWLLDLLTGRK